jgi:hypothetical protein
VQFLNTIARCELALDSYQADRICRHSHLYRSPMLYTRPSLFFVFAKPF